jgi:hypothetical protein
MRAAAPCITLHRIHITALRSDSYLDWNRLWQLSMRMGKFCRASRGYSRGGSKPAIIASCRRLNPCFDPAMNLQSNALDRE